MKSINLILVSTMLIAISKKCLSAQDTSLLQSMNHAFTALKKVMPPEWIVSQNDTIITITYCRSCKDYEHKMLTSQGLIASSRSYATEYFKNQGGDSVSFYSTLSAPVDVVNGTDLSKPHPKPKGDDWLRIEVIFTGKWSQTQFDSIAGKNEILKRKVLDEPLGKTSPLIFADFRKWIPKDPRWRAKLKRYGYYFERLPYRSYWYRHSIFIIPKIEFYPCGIEYAEPGQWKKYTSIENNLTDDFKRILQVIAHTLGIPDY